MIPEVGDRVVCDHGSGKTEGEVIAVGEQGIVVRDDNGTFWVVDAVGPA